MPLQTDSPTVDIPLGQPITEEQAQGWLPKTCFKHGPPGRIGVELEYLVHTDNQAQVGPGHHLGPESLQHLFDDIESQPLDSRFTVEPGGQVELSSRPAENLSLVISRLEADLAVLDEVGRRHGARLVGLGIDPLPPPPRHLNGPRYAAMDAYLSGWGAAGRAMMRSTASVQVNVEAAPFGSGEAGFAQRWELLHLLGPVLSAAFANSPVHPASDPAWAGWAGLRQAVWLALDPDRCRPTVVGAGETVPEAWSRWVLDAPLMVVRRPGDEPWTPPPGVTFRRWLREGVRAVPGVPPPTVADLAYHLTTLFPPVRARGHLEVRYIDEQPGRWWRVPASVISILVDDESAARAARAACEPLACAGDDGLAPAWRQAARVGLADPEIARAASQVLLAAAAALDRAGLPDLAELTADYLMHPRDPEERPC